MARRTATVLAVMAVAAVALPALPAAAGGGCHSGVTQGVGDTVEMRDACFTPTTLFRVDPGDSVTFVNQDPIVHNVGGNLWGHLDDLDAGQAFTATFKDAGIYPYACSYHPGMTGAIVVGEGTGVGNGETVAVTSFAEPSPVVQVRTVEQGSGSAPIVGWVAGGVIGLAAGLGIGVLVRRRTGGVA